MRRVLLAGLAAGVIVYVWSVIAYMGLGIGDEGMKVLPNEDATMLSLKQSIAEEGFYFFPGLDHSVEITEAAEAAWTEKYRQGPTGILIYHPYGSEPMTASNFLLQFLGQLVCGLLAAFVVSKMSAGSGARIMAVLFFALFAWVSVHVPQWNWYGFPGAYIFGQLVIMLVGWLAAGWVLARLLRQE